MPIGLLLILITLAAYWQVLGCKFVDFDDHIYVTKNPFLAQDLGVGGVRWAFGSFYAQNWHPLTWISHMVDCRLYGLNPSGHHLTNLLFHVANTLLLFLLLYRMTGSVWRSGFVAALFAVHPLHVESVAWVSERKDVLAAFFWLVTMYAYVLYAKRPSVTRYLAVAFTYALGLMAKPMVVSLPLVLLLLDYWPLDRMSLRWRLVWEKTPLFVLSAASCVITVLAQRAGGALVGLEEVAPWPRALNAAASYVAYITKMVWPSRLTMFYPYPEQNLLVWEGIGAAVLLAVGTVLALRIGRKHRYVAVGWLWYVVTLVPVIGLVQVGGQAMADRYTYMTLTGLFIIAAWGVPDLLARRGPAERQASVTAGKPVGLWVCAAALVLVLAVCTRSQIEPWHDTYSLFNHAIRVNPNDFAAYGAIGEALNGQERYEEAIGYLSKSVEIEPRYATAHVNLAAALLQVGRIDDGLGHLQTAQRLGFEVPMLHHNLAFGYWKLRKPDLAIEQCSIALRLGPRYAPSHNLLGAILLGQGRLDAAMSHWRSALKLDPGYYEPRVNLAMAYYNKADFPAAWREVRIVRRMGRGLPAGFVEALATRMPDPGE